MKSLGIDPAIKILRERAVGEEFDYGFVMDCLKDYANSRLKLSHLLKIGAIIRIKKGIYIFGENFSKRPYSLEILANMIFGPSYISLEWACQYYRLIPEKVTTVTSVTPQRSKAFQTPIGLFTYDHIPKKLFSCGINLIQVSEHQTAMIATKEKALVDLLVLRRGHFSSFRQFKETLFDDLRIDEDDVTTLDPVLLKTIQKTVPHSALKYLIQYGEKP